ncbi:hypothetical protein GCM10008959_15120 [Deinococcus seoulensis]|uniref:Uncharacterized protein n=1 Tax=Deinococcus seoulensis TaxID=1837379 RepID=A0ABQ2RPD0_9DEIO|nr:hypothetical protein GCM10008959_15120 [Deinococcus seoulensis]
MLFRVVNETNGIRIIGASWWTMWAGVAASLMHGARRLGMIAGFGRRVRRADWQAIRTLARSSWCLMGGMPDRSVEFGACVVLWQDACGRSV